MLSNKKLLIVFVIVVIFGGGYGGYVYKVKASETSVEVPRFREEKVRRGDIRIDFIGDGEAEIPVVNLDFEISGKLKELLVSNNEEIKKGDVVAKLDDTDYMNKLQNAQVQYDKALAKLEQTKQNYELQLISEKQKLNDLKLQFDKISLEYNAMVKIKEIYPQQQIEQNRIAYENAKSAYEAQFERYNILSKESKDIVMEKANVEAAQIALKTAEDDLENTILTAPMDAKILNITYKLGETIPTVNGAGEVTSDTNHFMVISDAKKMEVIVPISEIDLSNIFLDQEVQVEFEAVEGQSFGGKVLSIDSLPKIDNNGLVTYDVKVELTDGLDKIKTGMTCTVSFILNQRSDVLTIPNKAVSIVDGKQVVQVKDEQGNITQRTITTGLTDGSNVEVIKGLEASETVIVKDNN